MTAVSLSDIVLAHGFVRVHEWPVGSVEDRERVVASLRRLQRQQRRAAGGHPGQHRHLQREPAKRRDRGQVAGSGVLGYLQRLFHGNLAEEALLHAVSGEDDQNLPGEGDGEFWTDMSWGGAWEAL